MIIVTYCRPGYQAKAFHSIITASSRSARHIVIADPPAPDPAASRLPPRTSHKSCVIIMEISILIVSSSVLRYDDVLPLCVVILSCLVIIYMSISCQICPFIFRSGFHWYDFFIHQSALNNIISYGLRIRKLFYVTITLISAGINKSLILH